MSSTGGIPQARYFTPKQEMKIREAEAKARINSVTKNAPKPSSAFVPKAGTMAKVGLGAAGLFGLAVGVKQLLVDG